MRATVVETPKGPYFVKLTGPSATIDKAGAAFDQFLQSLAFKYGTDAAGGTAGSVEKGARIVSAVDISSMLSLAVPWTTRHAWVATASNI